MQIGCQTRRRAIGFNDRRRRRRSPSSGEFNYFPITMLRRSTHVFLPGRWNIITAVGIRRVFSSTTDDEFAFTSSSRSAPRYLSVLFLYTAKIVPMTLNPPTPAPFLVTATVVRIEKIVSGDTQQVVGTRIRDTSYQGVCVRHSYVE